MHPDLVVAVLGTGTGVGKTSVVLALTGALRRRGRSVWLHKPVACGGWADNQADDGRSLRNHAGDGQPLHTVCPHEFPEPASPHLAAAAAGATLTFDALLANLDRCRSPSHGHRHDLVVEGVGGLLVPLTSDDRTVADLIAAAQLPTVIVTIPDLGTLNHTALTVAAARHAGIVIVGLVINHVRPHDGSLAVRRAADELARLNRLPVLAEFAYGALADHAADELATAVLRVAR